MVILFFPNLVRPSCPGEQWLIPRQESRRTPENTASISLPEVCAYLHWCGLSKHHGVFHHGSPTAPWGWEMLYLLLHAGELGGEPWEAQSKMRAPKPQTISLPDSAGI